MKLLISFILTFTISNSKAQKIALLNTNLKSPILYTDSITIQQVTKGLFPVSKKDFDSLYANLSYVNKMLEKRQRSKMEYFELHSGNTIISVKPVTFSNGDRYIIKAITTIGEINSGLDLTNISKSNKKNRERIEELIAYLKENKEVFGAPIEFQPRFYNVIIVSH